MGMVSGIISLTLGAILMSAVFLPQIFNANTSGWDAGTVAIWSAAGVVGGASFLYGIAAVFGLV